MMAFLGISICVLMVWAFAMALCSLGMTIARDPDMGPMERPIGFVLVGIGALIIVALILLALKSAGVIAWSFTL